MSDRLLRVRPIRLLSILAALEALAGSAHAQESSAKTEARQHFQAGLALVRKGDVEQAVEAFESAFRTSPHYAVLYNLGQAYATLGRPKEAAEAFERYLAEGGDKVAPTRRLEVEGLIARQRARIGQAELEVLPEGAEAFVDGKTVAILPLESIELAAGLHVLGARKSGYVPRAEVFEILPGRTVRVTLELQPEHPVLIPSMGLFGVRCAVPDVEVWVDGERHATTPLKFPLLLPTGPHAIRFVRSGYAPVTRTAHVRSDRMEQLACAMVPDPAGTNRGVLRISASEALASVTVDGEPFRSQPLPPGPHAVRVERCGFFPFDKIVHLEPSREQTLRVILEPTPTTIRERDASVGRRRAWALGVGIGGLALAGGAVATYAVNAERYDEWRSERDQYQRELAGGTPTPEQRARASDLAHQAADIQRVDDLALGLAVTAGGALITAGALWLTSL